MMRAAILAAMLALGGCDGLPRDAGGTSEAIAARGVIRVGLTTDSGTVPGEAALTRALLRRLGEDMRVRVIVRRGATEPLLARLDAGEIDLVMAVLDDASPWAKTTGLGPRMAAATVGGRPHALRPVVRAGENGLLRRVWDHAIALGGRA